MRNELTAVEHNRRRRRPRPVTSSFRPYDLQQDYNLGLNSQAFEPQIPTRRSNLPQPSRTSRNAAIVNSKPHIPLPLKVPSDPKYETLKRLRAQKLEESLKISSIQDHGIEPRNEVKAPGNEWDEEDTPSEGFSPLSDKMPGLSSPVTLSSRGNDPDQSIRQTFSASSNVSDDENFSDIGDEAPYRVTHTPPSTIPRDGSPTPKPYGDPNVNESTPTQGKFKASEPPQSSLVYGRNRESFAEEVRAYSL